MPRQIVYRRCASRDQLRQRFADISYLQKHDESGFDKVPSLKKLADAALCNRKCRPPANQMSNFKPDNPASWKPGWRK